MRERFHAIGRLPELVFAASLFALGLVCAICGWQYGLGQLNDIGPGAFALGLGVAMMILAALSMREAGREEPLARRLSPVAYYIPGIIIWALLIEGAGLVISTIILMLCCSMAEERLDLPGAAILAIVLSAIGYLVFILGFGVTFDVLGEWF